LDRREQELRLLGEQESELSGILRQRQEAESRARLDYETAREEYRTLLDRGIDDPGKRAQWEQSRNTLKEAQAAREEAEKRLEVFRIQILNPAQREFDRAQAQLQAELTRLHRARDLKAGIACLGYALVTFILTFFTFNFFRRSTRLGRYAVIGTSFLGFGAVQVLLVSFKIAYPFLRDVVPVEWVVSLGGSAVCVAALVYLKNRFLSAPAVQRRRLWKGACPACGFPGPGAFCPWCGAGQAAACPRCGAETGRFLPYCRACGCSIEK
jgi:rRNA maturation endonuclease Nob1